MVKIIVMIFTIWYKIKWSVFYFYKRNISLPFIEYRCKKSEKKEKRKIHRYETKMGYHYRNEYKELLYFTETLQCIIEDKKTEERLRNEKLNSGRGRGGWINE